MLSSHFLVSQLAGLNGPVDRALGLYLCFQAQSPLPIKPGLDLLWGVEVSVQRPELSPPTEKRILPKVLKMVSFL